MTVDEVMDLPMPIRRGPQAASLLAFTLVACVPAPGADSGSPGDTSAVDADHDGYPATAGDCDDEQPAINPEATDVVGDGIDQNCDGVDGFDSDSDGHPDPASGGDDCDDEDPATYPGAEEIWYDGKDQGCVGSGWRGDCDQDGDGSCALAVEGGDDCDDGNDGIHPQAQEDNANGLDDNCNGMVDAFRVGVAWTPSAEVVLTVTVADEIELSALQIIAPTGGLTDGNETYGNIEAGSLAVFADQTKFEADVSSLTYIFSASGGIFRSTGTAVVTWGPRAVEVTELYRGACADITEFVENDGGDWTWDGLAE